MASSFTFVSVEWRCSWPKQELSCLLRGQWSSTSFSCSQAISHCLTTSRYFPILILANCLKKAQKVPSSSAMSWCGVNFWKWLSLQPFSSVRLISEGEMEWAVASQAFVLPHHWEVSFSLLFAFRSAFLSLPLCLPWCLASSFSYFDMPYYRSYNSEQFFQIISRTFSANYQFINDCLPYRPDGAIFMDIGIMELNLWIGQIDDENYRISTIDKILMMKLVVLILMGSWVAACYQLLYNVSQIVTLTTDINHYDFDSNWTMEYDSSLSKVFIQQPPSPSMQFTGVNFGNVDILVVNHTITANSTVVFVLGCTVRVYNFTLGFSLRDTITMPDTVVKVRMDEEYLYILTTAQATRYNLTTRRFDNTFNLSDPGYEIAVEKTTLMVATNNIVSSYCVAYVMYKNFTLIKTINTGDNVFVYLPVAFSYSEELGTLMTTNIYDLKMYNTSTGAIIISFKIATDLFQCSIICNSVLAVLTQFTYYFYQWGTWALLNQSAPSAGFTYEQIKCYSAQNTIAFHERGGTYDRIIYLQLTGNPLPPPPPTPVPAPAPTPTPNASSTTPALLPVPAANQSQQPAVSPPEPSPEQALSFTQSIDHFNALIQGIISSEGANTSAQSISMAASFTSASSATQSLLRPFINVLEDFWFYGYHSLLYPDIVEFFTSQVDLLNELRIKPTFLDYQLDISQFQYENERYNESQILQKRAPKTIFFLESTKDVYTSNFFTAIIVFVLFKILCRLFGIFKNKNRLVYAFYHFLRLKSRWWTLLVGIIETNIAPLAFYGFIQYNCFMSFDLLGKLNMGFTLLLFFISVFYSFVFYPLVYRYERRQMSSEVLEVSSFQSRSFWLEMTVKCVRSFLKATAHGIFINQQPFQLIFLITIDIGFIYIIMRLRKSFSLKTLFALVLIYFVIFLALDIGLLIYTIQLSFSGTLTDQKLIYYTFVFTLIILALLVVTILRIAILIIVTVYRSIRHFKDNKVQNKRCLAEIQIAKCRVKNINYMSRDPNQKKRVVFMHKKKDFDEQCLKKTQKRVKNLKSSRQPNLADRSMKMESSSKPRKDDIKSNLHKFILKIMNTPNATKKGINVNEQGI